MATVMPSSLEIAQGATLRPILDVADELGLEHDEVEPYGRYKAKVDLSVIDRLADRPDAKLINVTAITPTPAGEGKTTTSVSLTRVSASSDASRFCACARPRSALCSGSREARPEAATRRSCRWKT